ncbi:hypothetical protein NQ317_019626 [Molorchus minor]|uniref:Glycoside hydrolase family 31 N-terminal domain-containing protein n=1 Tax=Molorchus minor TaxID=1323400 RepID=A0ABQ9JN16_9CUCU|nr:hypothetical protein NQ317_019626 [Molorchus minor]
MALILRYISFLCFIIGVVIAVDKSNFKSCDQSSFCRRLRGVKPDECKYELDLESLQATENSLDAKLINIEAGAEFKFSLTAIAGGIFRIQVDETNPLHPRLEVLYRNKDSVVVKFDDNKAAIYAKPLKIEFFKNDVLVSVVNGRGLFTFEHFRTKAPENAGEGEVQQTNEDPGAWEENFKSHHDSKPRGPSAIGVDITFSWCTPCLWVT